MARRNASFQELFLQTLGQVGPTAMEAGKLIGDTNRADAESKANLALRTEQTKEAKAKNDYDFQKLFHEGNLQKAMETQSTVHEGTPTATGHAVDFQAAKKANAGFDKADAALFNFLHPEKMVTAGDRKIARERDAGLEDLAAEEKGFDFGEKQAKAGREAAESSARVDFTRAQIAREKDGGKRDRFKEITDKDGNVFRWNLDTNEKEPVGINKGIPGVKPPDVPALQAQTEIGLGIIDQMIGSEDQTKPDAIKQHPGFKTSVGAKGPSSLFGWMDEPISGTDAANFKALYDQVTGQAFLEAVQSLRGSGSITDTEGKKASAAITRMKTSQSEGDFVTAAREFQRIMRDGLERAKAKAPGQAVPAQAGSPKASEPIKIGRFQVREE